MTIQSSTITTLQTVMRGLAATVTVITAGQGDKRQAMSATSFTALSLDPPSILICINQSSAIYDLFDTSAAFCVNVLSQNHKSLAQACGHSDQRDARFEIGCFSDHLHGIPILDDAQANLVCTVAAMHDHGTHTIVIGHVETIIGGSSIRPLVYLDGHYLEA
mgnify:CR=1 FL=1|tara:strand:- start:4603 stop:5088 length:486 start_codon:yes stop_codon:yes gene_type:complete